MKRYLNIKNTTEFADPLFTRKVNRVLNPSLYACQHARKQSYYIRSYYEYLDTIDKGGKAYFVTATFNPESLPHFYGVPCFDYFLVRKLTSGAFKKKLNREGYIVKYFIVNEFGTHTKRPHHHMTFYLTRKDGKKVTLSGSAFLAFFRKYWPYGFCFAGKFGCEVINFRAFNYLCKYVCKDIELDYVLNDLYNKVYLDKYESLKNDYRLYLRFIDDTITRKPFIDTFKRSSWHMLQILGTFTTDPQFDVYCRSKASEIALYEIKEFEKHSFIRPRCSQGFGSCLANPDSPYYIDPFNPLVKLPSNNGYQYHNIPLYIYRKLFYDVVPVQKTISKKKFIDIYNGEYIDVEERLTETVRLYKLNDLGVMRKCLDFEKNLDSEVNTTYSSYTAALENRRFVDSLDFEPLVVPFDVIRQYVIFNAVYRGRLYKTSDIPKLDTFKDYAESLISGLNFRKTSTLDNMDLSDYSDYIYHPDFETLSYYIASIDKVLDRLYVDNDKFNKKKFDKLTHVSSFHKKFTCL